MSTYESKTGLRLEIKALTGKAKGDDMIESEEIEVVNYFKGLGFTPNTDSPTCTEFKKLEEDGLTYEVETDYMGNWVINLVFSDDWDTSDLYLHKSLIDLNTLSAQFANKFNHSLYDITVYAYNYYNGSDGPDLILKR